MRYRRIFTPGATYFFTLVTHQRARLFSATTNVELWRHAVHKVRRTRPFVIEADVIMPDHLHMIWTLPEGDADYPTRMRLIKTAFTKELVAASGGAEIMARTAGKGEREVWQRRYWEHLILDEADFQAHLDYVHINPVKHGFVARPVDWPHSTFAIWLERGVYDPNWGADGLPTLPENVGRE